MSPKLQCHISETTIGRDVFILKAGHPTGNWTFDIGLIGENKQKGHATLPFLKFDTRHW